MPPVLASPEHDDASAAASFCVYGIDFTKPADVVEEKTPPRPRITRQRSVDFTEDSTIVEIEKLDAIERDRVWYSKDEYDIIKSRNSLIVKMMKKGNFTENDEHSFRGLEHKLRDGFKQRRDNKFSALNCVLVSSTTGISRTCFRS